MFKKKILLGVTLSMALCLSSCYNGGNEITETTVPTEVTAAAVTDVSSESVFETTTENVTEEKITETYETAEPYDTENDETGLSRLGMQ